MVRTLLSSLQRDLPDTSFFKNLKFPLSFFGTLSLPKKVNRTFIVPLTFFLSLIALVCFQGCQYVAAFTGAGFARPLPNPASYVAGLNCKPVDLQVMSFNVMYGSTTIESLSKRFRDGKTTANFLPWSKRIPEIQARIADYSPDLLGLQEMESNADINAIAPLNQYSLVSYQLGGFQYGDAALLFKSARFELLDSGQFWLGPNPELPMSFGFQPVAMVRYVNWAMLRDKGSGFTFMFVNTHFDNNSKNKEPSAALFHGRIARIAKDLPVIVTGDFNTTADTERYQRITGGNDPLQELTNTYSLIRQPVSNGDLQPNRLIDHILVGSPCKVETGQWLVDTRPLKNGKPMSDHNLVFAKLNFSS